MHIAQKMKFSIKVFFKTCDEALSFLQIWSHLLKKFLMEDLFFGKWQRYIELTQVLKIPLMQECEITNTQLKYSSQDCVCESHSEMLLPQRFLVIKIRYL